VTKLVFCSLIDGSEKVVDARSGVTLMEAAVQHGINGIDAECGGACVCATCHVYVDEQWLATLDPPELQEAELLEMLSNRRANSRLSCQINVTPVLAGIRVEVPGKADDPC
jgi:2Fe-2S ferredoxin